MTLRTRISAIAAAAVALAVVVASVGIYVATARTLHTTVDRSLVELALDELAGPIGESFRGGPRPGPFGGAGGTAQVVTADGRVLPLPAGIEEQLPVKEATLAVAMGEQAAFTETVEVAGVRLRILTVPAANGLALQVARPLTEVEAVLDDLRQQLAIASLLGIALAAGLGTFVARRAVRPVGELTRLAEQVAETKDLSRRLGMTATDEIGRLASAFDRMLAELEQARHAQEQLVADASHELRTPLTSLRTNIEMLTRLEDIDPPGRRDLVDDVTTQIDEFAGLISGLVELARGERSDQEMVEVALDALVSGVVDRYRSPGREIRLRTRPAVTIGDPERLERAVANLLENAGKYAPDGPVDVDVAPGRVTVRDHGPGIAEEDLPRVFDRFHRAPAARGVPGSGLGLAIVAQIVGAHAGTVTAGNAPGGGAVFTISLPEATSPDGPPPPPTAISR